MVEKIKLQEVLPETMQQIMADLHEYEPFTVYDALEGGSPAKFAGRTCKAGY